ncbi:MAG: RNA 2',3'-cyclic phosphodiesterase [Desulfuromonadales bacterium]|nr:RNA 2',3'-cyclic phosphodiesterase [Desulfuromonadales bacterium]
MPSLRAFLAVPLPAELVRQAQELCRHLQAKLPGVRWVRPEAMHLTLRFFPDLPEESLEKIGEVMLSVGRLHSPFQVTVTGVGAFPSPARPRVIWLGITDCQPLLELYSTLDQSLERVGFPGEDRSFSPHLTLGRSRGPLPGARTVLERYHERAYGTLEVERLVLFESRLQPSGALHLPRKTALLG